MLRRLHPDQPDSFAFTPANQAWAEAQVTKFPEGRQASAIIPLLWRAQEQEGWLSRPAIEHVSDMLGLAYIRGLEVASFYFMFQLQPVGSVAHIQVCGTTSCMICGAEDLVAVCREKIAPKAHQLSSDGKFSWEEVECLGACANAPMAQIGKDYYEDLTAEKLRALLDDLASGKVPPPGPQNGRYAAEPISGLTSLTGYEEGRMARNASVHLAHDIGDTVKRIDGTEVPLVTPWLGDAANRPTAPTPPKPEPVSTKTKAPKQAEPEPKLVIRASATLAGQNELATRKGTWRYNATAATAQSVPASETVDGPGEKPATLAAARNGEPDDLKLIKGVGPKMEELLHSMGFFHYDQVAAWTVSEISWVDQNLKGFKGRVSRDNWVPQAKLLATGAETEFSQRAKKDDIYNK
ncbi:MAG: NADH-quinone oxidoreductase subunit E [Sedimentitalea sp.]